MCNLYSITTNQAAIIALFRVINSYVGNPPPMPGVFPDYPAPVIRNALSSSLRGGPFLRSRQRFLIRRLAHSGTAVLEGWHIAMILGVRAFFGDTLMEQIGLRSPRFQRGLHRWRGYSKIEAA